MRRLFAALINFKCCMWISMVLRLLLAVPHRRLLDLAKPTELYLPGDGINGGKGVGAYHVFVPDTDCSRQEGCRMIVIWESLWRRQNNEKKYSGSHQFCIDSCAWIRLYCTMLQKSTGGICGCHVSHEWRDCR